MSPDEDPLADWLPRFDLPPASIHHKRLFKTDLARYGGLSKPEQRQLTEAELIELRALIKPAHVQAPAVQTAGAEYLEIALFHVVVRKASTKPATAVALQKAVPYPAVIIMSHGQTWRIHLAEKRPPKPNERKPGRPDKLIIERDYDSGWLDAPGAPSAPHFWEQAFWNAFALSHCRRSNLQVLYLDLCARVLALSCAAVTGDYRLSDPARGESLSARRERLEQALAVDREIRSLRSQIRNEFDFARKLELNQRVSTLRRQHAAYQKNL